MPIWYRPGFLVVAFLAVGPFMLPILWLHPKITNEKKIIYSVVIVAVSAILGWVFYLSITSLMETYEFIQTLS